MPYTDYGYLDPLHIVWRKGTPEDPYTDRIEYIVVANQTVILSEIPDKVFRVRIHGMKEISYENFTTVGIKSDEFYVNYSTGVIFFHKDKEAETLTIRYKGRGFIQYPADRIYHKDKINNVVKSLSNIIDESNQKLNLAEIKIKEVEKVIGRAEEKIEETQKATDNAKKATEEAEVATDKALDAYETTRLVFKQYVDTYNDILTTYPNPEIGWTVQVYDTGIRYRWDGIDWVAIEALGGNVPKVSEHVDGLMHKEDYIKLKDISSDTDVRTIVFVCPQDIIGGVQDPHIIFPHDGEILEVIAYVSTIGMNDTEIEVQYSDDFITWNNLTDNPIKIVGGSFRDTGLHNLTTIRVDSGTVFRLNVPTHMSDALNLQVNIKIKID